MSISPPRPFLSALLACLLLFVVEYPGDSAGNLPVTAEDRLPRILLEHAGVKVFNGGFGSAMAAHPTRPDQLYLLTDRGPNFDLPDPALRGFVVANFAPQIGRFEISAAGLRRVETIPLRTASGRRLTGLPNPPGVGGTGEIPVDLAGNRLPFDEEGIDSEGLVALRDGTFWISDEYGPHLLHVDARGRTLDRIHPFLRSSRALPLVLARRRPNRGMEGLTMTPDGRTLVGIMQSPLDNPTPSIRRTSRVTRVLFYEIASGASRQYVYLQENPGLLNSEILAVSQTSFLVLERDGLFPGEAGVSAFKRVYRFELGAATDVSDLQNTGSGRLVGGRTLEELSEAELRSAGIQPVTKTLLVDLLRLPAPYPPYVHDKAEGLALVRPDVLAVANDDDFSIGSNETGSLRPKLVTGNVLDRVRVYFVRLPAPLR